MRTNFFCTNFLNTPRGPGHHGKIPGTSQISLFETQGRQIFEGEHELFGHHPFAWKTPTPPGGLRTQKVNRCVFFLPDLLMFALLPSALPQSVRKFQRLSDLSPLSRKRHPDPYSPIGNRLIEGSEIFHIRETKHE